MTITININDLKGLTKGNQQMKFTMPSDEDLGFQTSGGVYLYDGATSRKEIKITKVDDFNFTIEGNKSGFLNPKNKNKVPQSIFIFYKKKPKNGEGESKEVEVENYTSSATYDRKKNITKVKVYEKLPKDIIKAEIWIDTPKWGTDSLIKQQFSDEMDLTDTTVDYYHITSKIFCSENNRIPEETIKKEFGKNDKKAWTRKPLANFQTTRRDPVPPGNGEYFLNKGIFSSTSNFYNILVQFVDSSGNGRMDIDFQSFMQGKDSLNNLRHKSKFKVGKGKNEKKIFFKPKNIKTKKFHLCVREHGSGSIAHYHNEHHFMKKKDNRTITDKILPKYGWDILETKNRQRNLKGKLIDPLGSPTPVGLFFNYFDTSDSENFKITKKPSYSAKEYKSPNFQIYKKIHIYLIPRRWFYWAKTGSVSKEKRKIIKTVSTQEIGGCIWGFDKYIGGMGFVTTTVQPRNQACLDGFAFSSTLNSGGVHKVIKSDWTCDGCAAHCSWDLATREIVDCKTWEHLGDCPNGVTDCTPCPTQTLDFMRIIETVSPRIELYHGVWWDRFPSDISTLNYLFEDYRGIYDSKKDVFHKCQKEFNWIDLKKIYPEIRSGIICSHFFSSLRSTSKKEDEEKHKDTCFYISYKNMITPNVKRWTDYKNSNHLGWPELKMETEYPARTIWEKIGGTYKNEYKDPFPTEESSLFWKQYGPDGQFVRTMNPTNEHIFYGAGISPTTEKDLVGIVRQNKQVFYIWRKTNEEIECKYTPVLNKYEGHKIDFEGDYDREKELERRRIWPPGKHTQEETFNMLVENNNLMYWGYERIEPFSLFYHGRDEKTGNSMIFPYYFFPNWNTEKYRKIIGIGGKFKKEIAIASDCPEFWEELKSVDIDVTQGYELPSPVFPIFSKLRQLKEWIVGDVVDFNGTFIGKAVTLNKIDRNYEVRRPNVRGY